MRSAEPWSVRLIDVTGCVAALACLLAAGWQTAVGQDRAHGEIRQLARLIQQARTDALRLQAAVEGQRELLARRQQELAALGSAARTPMDTAAEQYFQMLSGLLAENGLHLVRQSMRDVATDARPSVRAQRYLYEVTGPLAGLLRFLKAIEESDFWADVSGLEISPLPVAPNGGSSQPGAATARIATLHLSLYFNTTAGPGSEPGGSG